MIKIRSANLETVCGVTSTLPKNTRAEIAFAGKSNVGKSSLINALLSRKSLARISSRPGKTQTINFYHINENIETERTQGENPFAPDFYLVDLPGYGFADTPEHVRKQWGKMIERYLKNAAALTAVFLLVDIRHKPSANDVQMADWIKAAGMPLVVVATKSDKLKRSQLPKALKVVREGLSLTKEDVMIPFSAVDKSGADEVWKQIFIYAKEA